MNISSQWFYLTSLVIVGWLLYLLAPVLTPFFAGAALAYLGDPVVDRLEARKLSRTVSVVIVFSVMTLAAMIALVVLLPMFQRQITILISSIPVAIDWMEQFAIPKLAALTGVDASAIQLDSIKQTVADHWTDIGEMLSDVLTKLTRSGQVIATWGAYALLIPVVTFYLLRDWDMLVKNIHDLLPRKYEGTLAALAKECDEVLAEFIRGQLLVMLALGIIYSVGLWIIGLDLGLLIGFVAGLVSFVPYLGFIVGFGVAGVAGLIQYQELAYLLPVAVVFGIGQTLEGTVLSPWLVGDRIGLHPVAVIFAVMAGGQLFGFLGVLLALPAASVIVVVLRHWHELYLKSDLYTP